MRNRQAGYALLVVLLLAALVLIGLSVSVPRVLTQGQREREMELIFRGKQYQRAIGLFFRKFGRFPNSVDELLRTNDRSFLRREYPDPMASDGKWRFIRVGPSGEFIGSVNNALPGGLGGAGSPPSGTAGPASTPATSPPESDELPAGDGEGSGPIVGVGSRSTAASIIIYEGFPYYHQWEFIYDPVKEAAGPGQTTPGGQPPPGGQPTPQPDKPPGKSGNTQQRR